MRIACTMAKERGDTDTLLFSLVGFIGLLLVLVVHLVMMEKKEAKAVFNRDVMSDFQLLLDIFTCAWSGLPLLYHFVAYVNNKHNISMIAC